MTPSLQTQLLQQGYGRRGGAPGVSRTTWVESLGEAVGDLGQYPKALGSQLLGQLKEKPFVFRGLTPLYKDLEKKACTVADGPRSSL